MTEAISHAIANDRTIDITTTGRRTGRPSRIEMWFHNVDGCVYLTGLPGPRDWYANLVADPALIFHLKETVVADLPALAVPVTDVTERTAILEEILPRLGEQHRLDAWVARSPLIEVRFTEPAG